MRKLLIFIVLSVFELSAQNAFPGAVGVAASATGGRYQNNPTVYVVTDTTDDVGTVGTFRHAAAQSAPKIIVLISGVYDIRSGRVDITGQGNSIYGYGPDNTVTITGHEVRINDPNTIIRNVRFRRGDNFISAYATNDRYRSLMVETNNADTTMVDHCSISWSDNSGLYFLTGPSQATVSNCLIWENFRFLFDYEWEHATLLTNHSTAGGEILIYNCAFAYGFSRSPRVASAGTDGVINTLSYNAGGAGGHALSVWKNDVLEKADIIGNVSLSGDESNTGVFRVESGTLDNSIFFSDNSWADSSYQGGLTKAAVDTPVQIGAALWNVTPVSSGLVESILIHEQRAGAQPWDSVDMAISDSLKARGHLTPDMITSSDTARGWIGTIGSVTATTLVPATATSHDSSTIALNTGWALKIIDVSSTATGRVRKLSSYTSSDSTFNIVGTWGAPAPSVGDSFQILAIGGRGTAYGKAPSYPPTNWQFDADSDGIPDDVEYHLGSNPVDATDNAEQRDYDTEMGISRNFTYIEAGIDMQIKRETAYVPKHFKKLKTLRKL